MNCETTRRETLVAIAGAMGAAVLFGSGRSHAEGAESSMSMPKGQMSMSPQDMKACIEECEKCHSACVQTISYCLQKGGHHASPAHILLLTDCAEICQTNANFMIRDSAQHKTICSACAEICDRCAQSCESMGEDAQLKACAKSCRDCAKSCREMAKN